jgi:hypothetical protein
MKKEINCFKCEYFFITWDKAKPYGCKAFGFKSALLPSKIVYQNSQKPCMAFSKK